MHFLLFFSFLSQFSSSDRVDQSVCNDGRISYRSLLLLLRLQTTRLCAYIEAERTKKRNVLFYSRSMASHLKRRRRRRSRMSPSAYLTGAFEFIYSSLFQTIKCPLWFSSESFLSFSLSLSSVLFSWEKKMTELSVSRCSDFISDFVRVKDFVYRMKKKRLFQWLSLI